MNILILILTLFFVSCGNSLEFKEDPSARFRGNFEARELNFAVVKERVLKNNCIQCHQAYEDYNTVATDKDKILDAILTDRMPKNTPPLNDNLKSLMVTWVEKVESVFL